MWRFCEITCEEGVLSDNASFYLSAVGMVSSNKKNRRAAMILGSPAVD